MFLVIVRSLPDVFGYLVALIGLAFFFCSNDNKKVASIGPNEFRGKTCPKLLSMIESFQWPVRVFDAGTATLDLTECAPFRFAKIITPIPMISSGRAS